MHVFAGRAGALISSMLAGCLFGTAVAAQAAACTSAPNVVFLVDTSGSMASITWHPGFDPSVPASCTAFTQTLELLHDEVQSRCGTTRSYRVDPALEARGISTRFDPGYLNWLHSLPYGHAYLAEIEAADSGMRSACLGGGAYAAYRESRLTAAQRFLQDVICRVSVASEPRLGLARPRVASDPAGGYLAVPVDDQSSTRATSLALAIDELEPMGWGPLGETLFHIYTYAMSRDPAALPLGVDDFTPFPVYSSDTAGNPSAIPPPSPVQDACRDNIVVVLADDAPTRDDFDPGSPGAERFEDFHVLIGNYNLDDGVPEAGDEEPGASPTCTGSCEVALYLDDIAMFMNSEDFRPDLPGLQSFRIYTVGFSREPFGNALLAKTADVGGGLFLLPADADILAAEITAASAPSSPVPALGGAGRVAAVLALAGAGLLRARFPSR